MTLTRALTGILLTIFSVLGCSGIPPQGAAAGEAPFYLPPAVEVELALAAGPAHIRSQATVYVFSEAGYDKVRTGDNGFTCLINRDGQQHGGAILRPTCWDREGSDTIVPVVLRVGELLAKGASAAEIEKQIDAAFQRGQFISPRKAGIAYMLAGDVTFDQQKQAVAETLFPPHYMVYAPGVSNMDIGMTDDAWRHNPSLPMVYDGYSGGSRTAYIIIPAAGSAAHHHR